MCGIVGYVQNSIVDGGVDGQYRNALVDLLFIDTLRGLDSTGVAVISRDYNRDHILVKKAVPGYVFVELPEYQPIWNSQNNPVIVIGHNRAATHGTVTEENAHPFVADHITLVHNGTIRNHHSLDSGVVSSVDSCHIAHAIAKHGAKKVLDNLDGSAILVWYDKKENSMNIARAKDRAIRWIFDEHGTCWFASEQEMLWSVLVRQGIDVGTNKFFTAEEHTWYKWVLPKKINILNDDTTQMGEVVKTKFEEFVPLWKRNQAATTGAGKSAVGESSSVGSHHGQTKWACKNTSSSDTATTGNEPLKRDEPKSKGQIKKADKRLEELQLAVGDEIQIKGTQFAPSSTQGTVGDIIGVWAEKGIRVVLPDVPNHVWSRSVTKVFKVTVYNLIKQHIKEQGRHLPIILAKLKNYKMRELVQGPGGILIPPEEFEALALTGCHWCPQPVLLYDSETTEWINGKPLCRVCSNNFDNRNERLTH